MPDDANSALGEAARCVRLRWRVGVIMELGAPC